MLVSCTCFQHICRLLSSHRHLMLAILIKSSRWNSGESLQSAAKLFKHLRYYLRFFSGLITNFYHHMLVINNIRLMIVTWQIFISQNCVRYEFFDSSYPKNSNNFAADCNLHRTCSTATKVFSWIEKIYIRYAQLQLHKLVRKKFAAQCKAGYHYNRQ